YFALPVLRQHLMQMLYTPSEILRAAVTVTVFLVAATLVAQLVLGAGARRARGAAADFAPRTPVVRLLFGGIGIGLGFHVMVMSGWLSGIGAYFGVVRSVAV